MPLYIVELLQIYLNKRTYKLVVNKSTSATQHIAAGVLQGSILGPVLFSYYINDLPIGQESNTALFADDTVIYRASWNEKNAIDKIQATLNCFLEYYQKLKIKINAAKTELIVFSHKKKLKNTERDFHTVIDNEIITLNNKVKFLGMLLDTKLIHKQHIMHACSKAMQIRNLIFPLMNDKSASSI